MNIRRISSWLKLFRSVTIRVVKSKFLRFSRPPCISITNVILCFTFRFVSNFVSRTNHVQSYNIISFRFTFVLQTFEETQNSINIVIAEHIRVISHVWSNVLYDTLVIFVSYVLVIEHLYASVDTHTAGMYLWNYSPRFLCVMLPWITANNRTHAIESETGHRIWTLLLLPLKIVHINLFPREHSRYCYLPACLLRFCIEKPRMMYIVGEEIDEYVHVIISFVSLVRLYKSDNV